MNCGGGKTSGETGGGGGGEGEASSRPAPPEPLRCPSPGEGSYSPDVVVKVRETKGNDRASEEVYRRATWRMYNRITTARTLSSGQAIETDTSESGESGVNNTVVDDGVDVSPATGSMGEGEDKFLRKVRLANAAFLAGEVVTCDVLPTEDDVDDDTENDGSPMPSAVPDELGAGGIGGMEGLGAPKKSELELFLLDN